MFLFLCLLFLIRQTSANEWREDGIYGTYQGHKIHQQNTVQRPCKSQDLHCIRQFFEEQFGCTPAHGPVPESYTLNKLPLSIPQANMTVVLVDSSIRGFNSARIKEFYVNKKTDTLVLEVEFKHIIVDTPKTLAIYHLKGREPIDMTYYTAIEFTHVSLTLTIDNYKDLHRIRAHVYAYFSDSNPALIVNPNPNTIQWKDARIPDMNRNWLHDMPLSAREGSVVLGPIYMAVFLNNMICNFEDVKLGSAY